VNKITLAAALAVGAACSIPAIGAPVPYNWTGTYAGVNLGDATGSSKLSTNVGESHYFDTDNIGPFNSQNSTKVHPSGFIGGAQVGYNKQDGHIVYGIEADIDSLDLNASKGDTNEYFDNVDTFTVNQSVKTSWLATVRPKIGWASGNSLYYVTGGVAFTDVSTNDNFSDEFGGAESASKKSNETGYALGAGIAYALPNNWIISGEYLYTKFGSVSSSGEITGGESEEFPGTLNHKADLTANIFRIAFSYKF
jgi:outer membrane immunogenic protein